VVERRNKTVVGMARSMMKAKSLLAKFWGEAVTMAVFILNHPPTKALKGKTPFEVWHGRKPNVSFLRTFGCVGHVKNTKPHLGKLEPFEAWHGRKPNVSFLRTFGCVGHVKNTKSHLGKL